MPHAISGVGRVAAEQSAKDLREAHQRRATVADVRYLADNMREEDQMEVRAQTGQEPEANLLHCFFASRPCMTMVSRHGHVMGMWGVVPEGQGGRIWMLGTKGMVADKQDRRVFLRKSRKQLDLLFNYYPVLFNVVDARNTVHVRWIRHMGFTFLAKHAEWGPEKRLFYEFVRI